MNEWVNPAARANPENYRVMHHESKHTLSFFLSADHYAQTAALSALPGIVAWYTHGVELGATVDAPCRGWDYIQVRDYNNDTEYRYYPATYIG